MGQTKEATIKIRAFPYYETVKDPVSGQDVRREHIARRGDTVELSEADYERAVRFDAIQDLTDKEVADANADAFSFETASEAQLATYIKTEKPSVDTLVKKVGNDPVLAQRVLDAENLATGNQPRAALDDKLSKVAAGSGS